MMTRRQFLKASAGLGAVAIAGRGYYFARCETWALRVTRANVPVPNLPPEFHGLRIAHLSDLHVGPHVSAEFVRRALQMVEPLQPQLIVLTGDYVSYDWQHLTALVPDLAALHAPLGVFAVRGNHDYFYQRQKPITRILRDAGIRLLANSSCRLGTGDRGLYLIGIDDPVTGHDDFESALHGIPPDACKVFLAHTPDVVAEVQRARGDLLLAGHTHGGQINLPFIGPPVVPSKYGQCFACGIADYEGTAVFVTRGVGVVEPFIRFRCPPEVALLTLHSSDWQLPEGGPETDMRPQVRKAREGMRLLHRLKRRLEGN